MWWLVLSLSFTAGTVVADSSNTSLLSLQFGSNTVNIFEETNGFSYELVREDLTTVEARITLENAGIDWTPSSINCTTDEVACVELTTNAVTLRFSEDILFAPVEGVSVTLTSPSGNETLGNCFQFKDDVHWFGGPVATNQLRPVQDSIWNLTPYIPRSEDGMAIAEPYWFNSEGDSIHVTPTSLFLDQRSNDNNDSICFYAANVSPYRRRNETVLQYKLFHYENPKTAHKEAVGNLFPAPTNGPNRLSLMFPTWSTGVRFGDDVNDLLVRTYAEEIFANDFNYSSIEIGEGWENCSGSLTFNEDKFPDIKNLTDFIHDFEFRVILTVHPFINEECEEYATAKEFGYLVQNEDGDATTSWWRGGNASLVDFTNEDAVEWFTSRLNDLKNSSGIDAFRFEAGEASWVPDQAVLTGPIEQSPGIYTTSFARSVAEISGVTEIGTGLQTQDLRLYVKMQNKEATWDAENGLASLIPTLLTMNVAGYGYVIPDVMSGGNSSDPPSDELLIRWIQATTFMPAIKHSFAPWDYNNETLRICHHYIKQHEWWAGPILGAIRGWVNNDTHLPVNAPVWFVDPDNAEAYNISDEYLMGRHFLIAPIIEEGARSRDIFLPTGTWHDMTGGLVVEKTFVGPIWLRDYPVPLDVLPYFIEEEYLQLGPPSTPPSENGAFLASSNVIIIFASAIFSSVTKLFN